MAKKQTFQQQYKEAIDITEKEFNQMALYLIRLNEIANRRDEAGETGEILNYYRSSRSLLKNAIAFLDREKIEYDQPRMAMFTLGSKLRTTYFDNKNEKLREKNLLIIEEEISNLNEQIDILIMRSGLIFPKKHFKSVGELREEDY